MFRSEARAMGRAAEMRIEPGAQLVRALRVTKE
jgi:hypothetical protein